MAEAGEEMSEQEKKLEFLRALAALRGRPSQTDVLMGLVQDARLFFDPALDAGFATFAVGDHEETSALRAKAFKRWLVHRYVQQEDKPPKAQTVLDVVGALEAQAQFHTSSHCQTVLRVGGDDDTIYLDLANPRWEVVKITASGWDIVSGAPVKFRRPRGMRALPTPTRGGDLSELRRFVNAGDRETWVLLVAWLVSTLRAHGPYPVLALLGEQGSAKTTTAEVLKRLIDPGKAAVRAEPREVRDLMIAATNGWLLAFDNISTISGWLSDALCRMATGGGFATRELYSDGDEVLFDAERPVILTGIEEMVSRPDLVDRTVMVSLPRIAEHHRRAEAAFWSEFEALAPGIFGGLLDVLSATIEMFPRVKLATLPRMADFAEWAVAVERVMGWPDGTFLRAYAGNRAAAQESAVELSSIGPALRTLTESGWAGTATELLERLAQDVPEVARRAKDWPTTPRMLAGLLKRLAPALRGLGVDVEFVDEAKLGPRRRQIRIRMGENYRSQRSDGSGADLHDDPPFPRNDGCVRGASDQTPPERWALAQNDAGNAVSAARNARNGENGTHAHAESCDCLTCVP